MRPARPRLEGCLAFSGVTLEEFCTHRRDSPYSAATALLERPSSVTAVITSLAIDIVRTSSEVRTMSRDTCERCPEFSHLPLRTSLSAPPSPHLPLRSLSARSLNHNVLSVRLAVTVSVR